MPADRRSRQFMLAALLMLPFASVSAESLLRAHVSEGTLIGKRESSVTAFLGVPYAAPPVGEKRWKAPEAASRWDGERQADRFADSCQQQLTPDGFGPWTPEYVVHGGVSENCLYLNVWTSARTTEERLPVLFWIHGGGFSSGSGSVPIYNGRSLATKGIVVVTINYRVGVYGFLAHPELTAESGVQASGNYGLLDQLAALRWVRSNIAAFGGDPNRITIAGQSAGAASVHHLIASPLAKGLFTAAIAQSGSGMGIPIPSRTAAEASGTALSEVDGRPLSIAQLRALTASELDARIARMPASGWLGLRFVPCVDGRFLNDANVGKNTNDTPLLTGLTANEVNGIDPAFETVTADSFTAQIERGYGSIAPQLTALYPATSDSDAKAAFEAHARDRGLASMYVWAGDRWRATRHPIYAYLWTHAEPGPESRRYKAFHSSEIPYVFDMLDTASRPFTANDRTLAATLSDYWVKFVKSGNPNGKNMPAWPAFTASEKVILELGDPIRTRPVLTAPILSVFEEHTNRGGQLTLF